MTAFAFYINNPLKEIIDAFMKGDLTQDAFESIIELRGFK